MTERDERPIVKVEATGPVTKVGKEFRAPVLYTLDDGTTIETDYSTSLKRDVLPGIADMNQRASRGNVKAKFHDGQFWGTSTSYSLWGDE